MTLEFSKCLRINILIWLAACVIWQWYQLFELGPKYCYFLHVHISSQKTKNGNLTNIATFRMSVRVCNLHFLTHVPNSRFTISFHALQNIRKYLVLVHFIQSWNGQSWQHWKVKTIKKGNRDAKSIMKLLFVLILSDP